MQLYIFGAIILLIIVLLAFIASWSERNASKRK